MITDPKFIITMGVLYSVCSWFALAGIGLLIAITCEWVDDNERKYPNLVLYGIARMLGWKYKEGRTNPYHHEDKNRYTDGSLFLLQGIIASAVIGATVLVGYYYTAVVISIYTVGGLLYFARFTRRLKKRLDKHEADKEAHS